MFTFRDFDPIKHAGVSRFSLKSELLWLPPPIYCILHYCKTCNPRTIPLSSGWSSNLACLYRWLQLPLIAWVLSLGSTSLSGLVHAGILEISSSSKGFQMRKPFYMEIVWWKAVCKAWDAFLSSYCTLKSVASLCLGCSCLELTFRSASFLAKLQAFPICFTSCS